MADRGILEWNGISFENVILRHLSSRYSGSIFLHDLGLYSSYLKKDTQIDIVFIDTKGVFVIEAKNWKNWVEGNYGDKHWSGQGASREVITTFNPVNQNFIHIRALRNAIRRECDEEPVLFHNIVCFPNSTTLRTECKEVVNLSYLSLYLDRILIASKDNIQPEHYKELIERVTR